MQLNVCFSFSDNTIVISVSRLAGFSESGNTRMDARARITRYVQSNPLNGSVVLYLNQKEMSILTCGDNVINRNVHLMI